MSSPPTSATAVRHDVRLTAGVVLVALALATTWAPGLSDNAINVLYVVVNGGAGLLALAGARHRVGAERRVPLIVAAGLCANAVGDLVFAADAWRREVPDASPADAAYLLAILLLATALFLAAAAGSGRRFDPDAVIDAVTVVVVSVLVLWDLQVRFVSPDGGLTDMGQLVLTTYPVMDAVVLGLLVRLVLTPNRRAWGGGWMLGGMACWLAADLVILFEIVGGLSDAWPNLGWMVGGILMAQSTWPSHRAADARVPHDHLPGRRVLVAILPLGVPTALLLLDHGDADRTRPVILVATVVLLGLAVARTARLLDSEARARRELEVARDHAVAASRAKSEFLATMSHEIRTPMNGVLGLTGLLLAGELDDRQRRYAEGVEGAGQALLTIINDLLDFSKIEAGRIEIESVDLDLQRVLTDVADIVLDPARSDEVDLRVECDAPTGLVGDPWRLRQVLLNLTANAVKFTPVGLVRLGATVTGEDAGGVDVCFEVTDSGIGIERDDLQRIFEPFAQADSSTTREFGGTGLGLTISQRLVAAMGGTLTATSTPGDGSRFWFTLRLARAPGRRVLLVEDGEVNRLVAEGILTHLGYDVVLDADPSDVDVVVTDLERVASLRTGGVPVVGVSKPIQPAELAAAMTAAQAQSATVTRTVDPGTTTVPASGSTSITVPGS